MLVKKQLNIDFDLTGLQADELIKARAQVVATMNKNKWAVVHDIRPVMHDRKPQGSSHLCLVK